MSFVPPNTPLDASPVWDVALLFPAQGQWSVNEYLSLTDASNRLVEFDAGCIEVLEMPTIAHQRILRFLLAALSGFVNARNLGEVLFAALPLRLGNDKYRESDLIFVRHGQTGSANERFLRTADLVVEVVSGGATSRQRDLVIKREEYAAAGIPEYWIVDPLDKRITVLTLAGAEYAVHGEFAPGEQATSRLLEGLAVDVTATFRAAEGFGSPDEPPGQ
ncbi:MAG: Uma2 family endonuclease [Planctomycetota bacterium]|nr:MAG: Uma2 family endonuclease [Planctomycetota bacterium]